MNAAILLLAGSAIGSVVVFEARRKWRDWRRAQQPFRGTPLHDGVKPYEATPQPMLVRRDTTPSPVDVRDGIWHHPSGQAYWVGLDLATGDDLCVEHDAASYCADDQSSFGTIGGVSE
jgi:hypothetical protein